MANGRGADIYREMTDWLERFALHEINLRGDFIAHRDQLDGFSCRQLVIIRE